MDAKKNIFCILPLLSSYRVDVFQDMSSHAHVNIIYSASGKNSGFAGVDKKKYNTLSFIEVKCSSFFNGKILYQHGLFQYMCKSRPDAIIIFSNPRYLSFWLVIILGKFLGIAVYPHGHGLFKKRLHKFTSKIIYVLMYKFMFLFISGYICYTRSVKDSFGKIGIDKKLRIANNSILNSSPVLPSQKHGFEAGILFIGRLREGVNLEYLISAISNIRDKGFNITLHIIGGGRNDAIVQGFKHFEFIHYYGMIYDMQEIADISLKCSIGCYPGNAGLSVVHYMSLSLPVLVHNNLAKHQGPEPSYVIDGHNGFFIDYDNIKESLENKMYEFFSMSEKEKSSIQENAYLTYQSITTPSYAEQILQAIQ